ncbi:MAG TPA: ABC transporter permease [Candidatus Paceibacterota bacterium]|nr:ABC transporter permease [Candidatus Paceibacterota bacterium]
MTINDLFNETYASLTANKARSGLTMLGIVIGIGSVIAMISVGQGAQGSIEARINSLGSNLLLVEPGAARGAGTFVSSGRGSATTLTLEDSDAIAQNVAQVSEVAPEASRRFQVTATGTNTNTEVVGTVPSYQDVRNVQVDEGSFITDAQVQSGSRVAVLGPTARDDLFGEGAESVGDTIRINNTEFTVIGVTVAKGGTGFGSQDDMIYVPLTTAQRYLTGGDSVTTISVQAANQQAMTQVQQDVTALLLDRHRIGDPTQADFSVLNQEDIVATATSVTGTFTLLLGAIAGISLLVGGIGIMNMMLTTVTERTREIGLRKAIGAKKDDITMQFLAESVALTVIGGVIGIALGWLGASLISSVGGITTSVSGSSVILAFGVSAAIGVAFGYYPARRASALNPIEALRYE